MANAGGQAEEKPTLAARSGTVVPQSRNTSGDGLGRSNSSIGVSMSLAILNVLSDGPMFHREMVDIGLPTIFVDIQAGKLLREGKIKRDTQGRYCLPTAPPADKPLTDLRLREAKKAIQPPTVFSLHCRVCDQDKALSKFPKEVWHSRKPRCS